ncbi:MAG: hypothetical protein KBF06_09420 [Bacteroidales bacterium]|jgi:glutathione peroxidase|nr:hypothetical protein [Bacteroidales bacterium]MBP9512690.1 hypothetical protein [Bacteroidales bacterium]OQC58600.1 MAG: Hydroperoxy fatty acid reductase gpx1 [Bacteroidetes bacterium ADurb.Bin012]
MPCVYLKILRFYSFYPVKVKSKCGLTPQYEKLQQFHDNYHDKNFQIVAFPVNNFLNQESGTESEIRNFCTTNNDGVILR